MHVCACRGNFNPEHCINNIPRGILGKQEEVRATTPRFEGGKLLLLTAAMKIKNQKVKVK